MCHRIGSAYRNCLMKIDYVSLYCTAPGILELASNEKWADEFLSTAKEPMGPDWSGEFVEQKSLQGLPHPAGDLKWAEEYLDHTEHRPWSVPGLCGGRIIYTEYIYTYCALLQHTYS